MDQVPFYLQLGFRHISDLAGYDHMLFLIALCAIYRLEQWRPLVVLVTAFTLGHSVTLALSALEILVIPSAIIEFLIPTTILLTALNNLVSNASDSNGHGMRVNYAMAMFFGFVHGMGFSNYFKALLMGESSILWPLLGFNLGIEVGQLLIVTGIIVVAFITMRVFAVRHRDWSVFISGAAAGLSVLMMIEKRFW